jgi:hypothetical protein
VNTLLWLLSGVVMGILLVCLALRGLKELLSVDVSGFSLETGRISGPVLFVASLAVLWLGALLAYGAVNGGFHGFFSWFFQRMTQTGDGPRYQAIAESGYASSGDTVNNIVFYPLYPFLVGVLGRVLGGHIALAGVILSQTCYGLSAVVMARLAEHTCAHPRWAWASYVLYPFGFFCLGLFTEGLFLLLTLSGLYAIRRRKWALCGVCGVLCALCRTQGILLVLPGCYEAVRDWKRQGWRWDYLWALTPLLGFGAYLVLNKIVCGSFFAYQYYESIEPWWQTPQWLGKTVAQQWDMALAYPGLAKWIYWPQLALYFLAAALLLAGGHRGLSTDLLLYGTAYLGMCYTASWLISGGRYMLGCVPLFLCVGQLKGRGIRGVVLAGELVFFGLFYCYFAQGQAIM